MRRDEKGLLHLSAVVFGPWSAALGHDMQWIYARLPTDVVRSKMERIEEDGAWYLRFDCLVPPREHREAIQLEVSSMSACSCAPEIERRLLEKADGVIFVVDTAIPNEFSLTEQHDILEGIHPNTVVYQFDDAGYDGNATRIYSPKEICEKLGVTDVRFNATRASRGEGVVPTLALLVREMMLKLP